MKRKLVRSMAMSGLLLGMLSFLGQIAGAAMQPATLTGLELRKAGASEELILHIEGEYSFKAYQASQDSTLIDLMGVRAGNVAAQGDLAGAVVKDYSLLQYTNAAHVDVTHLTFSLSQRAPFHVQQAADGLHVAFEGSASTPAPSVETPSVDTAHSDTATIQRVSVAEGENGATIIDVVTQGDPAYRTFTLQNPDRLVLDFEGAQHAGGVRTYRSPSPLLSDVRVGQFRAKDPSVVRVVADLVGNPTYDVQKASEGVKIVLKSRLSSAQPSSDTADRQVVPGTATSVPASVPEKTPAATREPTATRTADVAPSPVQLDSALPVGAPAVAAFPKPEVMGEISENAAAVEAARVIATSTDSSNVAQEQPPAGSSADAPQTAQYTGEPISLNLKDVDLKDFFRLIHEISGLNIIVDPNVSGNVTLVLDNVPWDQALDIVLKNNQLGKTLEGNVLRIAKLSTLTAEQGNVAKLAAAKEEAQPLVTKFVAVNYAKASQLASLLKSWVGGGALTKRGTVLVDDRTNTLIVSDIATQIPVILSVVQRLDTKTKQVAIEARVERVSRDFTRTLGNALALGFKNRSGSTSQGGATGPGTLATAGTIQSNSPPIAPNLGNSVIGWTPPSMAGFGAYAISNAGARYIINDVISAEELTDKAKLISKPMIVTQNNVPGDIIQGLEIPVQTNINNTITITYVQASLQMTVTPQVTADGNVFLVIKVTDNTPGAAIVGSPGLPINQQSATTQVLVPDGGTVIFGGVTVNQTDNSADYVPVLGKIPILGNLFKQSTRKENDVELLFFVTPKILQG
jgi:type IV pilus assembly protein PilQ